MGSGSGSSRYALFASVRLAKQASACHSNCHRRCCLPWRACSSRATMIHQQLLCFKFSFTQPSAGSDGCMARVASGIANSWAPSRTRGAVRRAHTTTTAGGRGGARPRTTTRRSGGSRPASAPTGTQPMQPAKQRSRGGGGGADDGGRWRSAGPPSPEAIDEPLAVQLHINAPGRASPGASAPGDSELECRGRPSVLRARGWAAVSELDERHAMIGHPCLIRALTSPIRGRRHKGSCGATT
jgi:hypothetical protein